MVAPGPGDFQKEADRILLGRFAPAAVLVNSNLEVLQFRGRTSPYLEPPAGPASFNLLKMARDNLPLVLGKAIGEARRKNKPIRHGAHLHDGKTIRKINIEVVPVKVAGSSENCFLVLFEEAAKETAETRAVEKAGGRKKETGGSKKPTAKKDGELKQLRRDLAAAREYVQAVIEQHDVSNEELKCANEEVLSSNEELQSTNEQLGTAKEELQSTNEELVTLNEESETRNAELSQLNSELNEAHGKLLDYVNAMADTARAPLLVLGADLKIQKANDAFYKTFQVSAEETRNRLIFELGNGQWKIPQLCQLLSEIVSDKVVLKDFEVVHSFPQIGRRVMVLNARRLEQKPGVPHMILLSIEDITDFKQIEEVNQWLAAIVESSSDAIIGEDLEGNIVSCNRGVSRLFGYASGELIGKHVSVLVPPEREGEDQRILERIRRGEHVEHYETRRRRKDGTLAEVSLTVSPVKDAHGKIIGASKIARDVTERKRVQAALIESEERFRNAADSAPVLIWISGADKLCIWVNKPWLDFVGRPLEQEISNGWTEHMHPADYDCWLEIYTTSFEARQEFKVEYRLRRHDGEYRWFLDHGIPRYFGTEFVGYIGSCVDVTDRRIAEEDLKASLSREKEARQSAEAASSAKDSFLAALSHELRTPLNPVLLIASDAAKNPEVPRDLQRDFETIRKNVELEARLIDDLLDLTRITVGKLRLNMEVQSAHTILRDAIAAVKPDAIHRRLKLVLNLKAERDEVRCDEVRLQQVFWNVLKNAVKFTPDKGKIVVETSVSADKEKLIVKITDTGIGMMPEELDHLFLTFSQGIESHRFGGLGLGLAISRKLIEFHSGEIRATSDGRDRGATFSIELPLAQTKNGGASPSENGADESPSEEHPKKIGGRILLVEDHEPTRTALTHLLIRRHYHVAAAGSVSEAREIAEKEKFDFVISDIGLPDGSGNDLMSELRERHGLKGIALTGYGMEHDIASTQTAGFVAHLTKPVHVQMLENALAIPALKGS